MISIKKTCLALLLLSSVTFQQEALGGVLGLGMSSCRDYLSKPEWRMGFFNWFEGYVSNGDSECQYLQSVDKKNLNYTNFSRQCLADKVHILPGIGASLDGTTGIASDLEKRVYQACYNDPDKNFVNASSDAIAKLNKDYGMSLIP